MAQDVNVILINYLQTCTTLGALIGYSAGLPVVPARIYCPRIPDTGVLPCLALRVRGGKSTPYIPPLVSPSFQFDCWANDPITARQIYNALYDALQGIQNTQVNVGGTNYLLMSAIEEVQGQDLVDPPELPKYYRVLSFFTVNIRASN